MEKNEFEVIQVVSEICKKLKVSYFLIGAAARNVLFENAGISKAIRRTNDVDFGVAVKDWEEFEKLKNEFMCKGFRPSGSPHRLLYSNNLIVDIIPFGEIAKENSEIAWPPDNATVMNILGFKEAYSLSEEISINDKVKARVCSLEGLIVLKFISWIDREKDTDASDIGRIIENISHLKDENLEEYFDKYTEVFQGNDLTDALVEIISKELSLCLDAETKSKIRSFLETELKKAEDSSFIQKVIGPRFFEEDEMNDMMKKLKIFCDNII